MAETTVCVISYNYGHFLEEAIRSVLAQSTPAEAVVIDDGSTDATAKIARTFAPEVRYLWKPNGGLSDARNFAAARCRTPYVCFLDADDQVPSNFVTECEAALRAHPSCGYAYTPWQHFGASDAFVDVPDYSAARLKRGPYIGSESLIRTAVAQSHPYDTALRHGLEDWEFYISLAEASIPGIRVGSTAVRYRRHGNSMGATLERSHWRRRQAYAYILFKHRTFFGVSSVASMIKRSVVARAKS